MFFQRNSKEVKELELTGTGVAAFRISGDIWFNNKGGSSVVCCSWFFDKHVSFFTRCNEQKRRSGNWD